MAAFKPLSFERLAPGEAKSRLSRPYLLIPVGSPARDATVPDIARKPLDEIRTAV